MQCHVRCPLHLSLGGAQARRSNAILRVFALDTFADSTSAVLALTPLVDGFGGSHQQCYLHQKVVAWLPE